MKKIGIVGYGYVGKAMARFFTGHYEVFVYDPAHPAADHPLHTFVDQEGINQCDLAVVCVPTPMTAEGECDTSIVIEAIDWIKTPLILLKSTVTPGTTEFLARTLEKRIVFSPEYCGESSYWTPYRFHTDIKETPFFIFGGEPDATSEMVDYFLPVTGPVKTYRQTDAHSAELAKYMENSFYAMKIVFCYEFFMIAQRMGCDFNEVRELWLLDPRINPMHTAVFKGNEKPYSGKCLPKDLAAIIEEARTLGYEPSLLSAVKDANERIGKLLKPE